MLGLRWWKTTIPDILMEQIFENPRTARKSGELLRERLARHGVDLRTAVLEILRSNLIGRVVDSYSVISFLSGVFGPSCDAFIRLMQLGPGEGYLIYDHCNPNFRFKIHGWITYYQRIGKIIRRLGDLDLVNMGICGDDYDICSIGAKLNDGTEIFSLIKTKAVMLSP